MAKKVKEESSGTVWAFLNDVRGALDPEFDAFGEWVAGKVPEGSALRNPAILRGFGILKQFIERSGKRFGPAGHFFLEAVSDLGDYVTAALRGEKKADTGKSPADGWIKDFVKSAGKRFADAVDPSAEVEKLKKEFQARLDLLRFVEEASSRPGKAESQQEPVKFDWDAFNTEFIEFLNNASAFVQKLKDSEFNKHGAEAIKTFRKSQKWIKRSRARQRELMGESGKPGILQKTRSFFSRKEGN